MLSKPQIKFSNRGDGTVQIQNKIKLVYIMDFIGYLICLAGIVALISYFLPQIERLYSKNEEINSAIKEIKKLSERDKIIVEHTLNRYEFPKQLEHMKPVWWDEPRDSRKRDYCRQIMKFIEKKVAAKKMVHYHIVEHLRHSEAYFEEWWTKRSMYNPKATGEEMTLR